MTDEQIKQNAEEYADNAMKVPAYTRAYDSFIAGAHSRDEEIEKIKEGKCSLRRSLHRCISALVKEIDGLEDELKKLRNPWRDAKKELPKEYENVIVMIDTNTPTCGYVENGKFILDADYLTGKVMCWMPIPQAPKNDD